MQAQHFRIKGIADAIFLTSLRSRWVGRIILYKTVHYSTAFCLPDSYDVPTDGGKMDISRDASLGRTISLFSPFSSPGPWKTGIRRKLNRIEDSVHQLRESHRAWQLSGLLLGLSLYSYRVRELVACWLFFIILFVVLALLVLGALLAWYAWIYAFRWARTTTPVAPVLVLASAEIHLETISGARELK
jgi:hypothetical protein